MGSGKIKILHLIASVGIGGAERILFTLLRNIDREKFDLVLGIFVDQRKSEDIFWNEAEEFDLPLEPIKFRSPYDLLQILQIYRILKKHHPDIIHTHGYKTNILGFFVAKLFKMPIVTTVHGLHPSKIRLYVYLSSKLLRHFDRIIAVSDQIREQLRILKVPSKKISTIRNIASIKIKENLTNTSTFREEVGIPAKQSSLVSWVDLSQLKVVVNL